MKSQNTQFNIKDSILDLEKNLIDAKINTTIKDKTLDINLKGETSSPQISIDAKDLLKEQINKNDERTPNQSILFNDDGIYKIRIRMREEISLFTVTRTKSYPSTLGPNGTVTSYNDYWAHLSGRTCFNISIDPYIKDDAARRRADTASSTQP